MATTIRAEIEIDAPVERVWAILADLPRYGEWNPFTPRVDGSLSVGKTVMLHVMLGRKPPMRTPEVVSEVEPGRRFSWGRGGSSRILRASRSQVVEPVGAGRTRYVTADVFAGVLSPLVIAIYGKAVERGFRSVAEALKVRAESTRDAAAANQ